MTDNEIDYPHYFLFAQHQWCWGGQECQQSERSEWSCHLVVTLGHTNHLASSLLLDTINSSLTRSSYINYQVLWPQCGKVEEYQKFNSDTACQCACAELVFFVGPHQVSSFHHKMVSKSSSRGQEVSDSGDVMRVMRVSPLICRPLFDQYLKRY